MLLFLLIVIFVRPFISSLAFPYLNAGYSLAFLSFLSVYIIHKKVTFSRVKILILPFVLFFSALLICTIFSQNKLNSILELYKYIGGVLLFFVSFSLPEEHKNLLRRTIILAGLVISFLAIYQYFFSFKHVSDYLLNNELSSPFAFDYLMRKRVFLPFVTPGILGGYLVMIIPLVLISKNRLWFLFPLLFALLLTKSLGAFLSLFCALVIYLCLQIKIRKTHIFSLFGLFFLIVIIFISRSTTQKEYLHPVFSTVMRLSYWRGALGIIITHPWVGVGLGNFNLQMSRFAHNSYLQIWAEMGILGLFSFVWIVYVAFKFCLKNLAQPLYKKQMAGLFAASAVFLIHNFLDFTFFLPEVAWIWWVILGLAVV
jgi:O-antigen ligase